MAALAVIGAASQAFASTPPEANPTSSKILLESASMVTKYTANVAMPGDKAVTAYSNGVTFSYINLNPDGSVPHNAPVYSLFGFCVDITHEITLGNLNYTYTDNYTPATGPVGNPLPTDFDGHAITPTQLSALTKLIDTGWELHESEAGKSDSYKDNVDLQLAAIQAAIWKVEGGVVTLNDGNDKAGANVGGALSGSMSYSYQDYFNFYSSGAFTDLGDHNDTFYTIIQASPNYDDHQSFAVGWPLPGVPEPTTWAMMIVGFFGLGSLLRSKRGKGVLAA